MAYIKVDNESRDHILKQIKERYPSFNGEPVLSRMINTLKTQAPDDWRFTISPSARFFVVDRATKVKILGYSYKDFGKDIGQEIQKYIEEDNTSAIYGRLKQFIKVYIEGLKRIDLDIIHELKTAYPPEEGEIAEEKRIMIKSKEEMSHAILIKEKKFSARPNAVVLGDGEVGELWVRQSLNWININNPNLEYLYFERLTPQGINKAQRKVFSYDMKGVLIPLDMPGCPQKALVCGPAVDKSVFKSPREFRSDTYWMLPTYLDNRYIGLDFREREPSNEDFGPLSRNEMAELYFLKKIIAAAKGRF